MSSSLMDQVVLLLTGGLSPEKALAYAAGQLTADGAPSDSGQAEEIVVQARRRITLAADYARDEEIGKAVLRLEDLYSKSTGGDEPDYRTALQAQRELNRLLGLHRRPPAVDDTPAASAGEAERRLDLISTYLLPLELADEKYPIEEHARLAADAIRQGRPNVPAAG